MPKVLRGVAASLVVAGALAGSVQAGEPAATAPRAPTLEGVPRRIVKHPTYATKPGYCLLVAGSKLETRVWVVLDGDTVYLDRNGNGDLTEAGEKITLEAGADVDETDDMKVTSMEFALGDLPPVGGATPYTGLSLMRFVVEPKGSALLKPVDTVSISLLVGGTHSQGAQPSLAPTPEGAPVIHVGGPLQVNVATACDGRWPSLTHGAEGEEITVQIGTPGLGAGSWSSIGYDQVPEDVKPVLHVSFPPAKAGGPPIEATFTLDDRC